jgi:hypothetical protein
MKFTLTLDDVAEHAHSPTAHRLYVVQMLHQAAQAIAAGYPDPRTKTGEDEVQSDHESIRHASGDIIDTRQAFAAKKVGSWLFNEG